MVPCGAVFEWDDANIGHIARHDVTPIEVQELFIDEFGDLQNFEVRRGALRYSVTGQTEAGRILFTVFEIRGGRIRTVTAFSASKKERAAYLARRSHGQNTLP